MELTARYTLTPSEARRGTRAFRRSWYVGSLVGGLALAGLGGIGAGLVPAARTSGLFLALAGLLFAILPEVVLRRALARRGALAQAEVEATLTEAGLFLRSGRTEGQLAWESFRTTRRRGGFWIFEVTANQAVLVPERAFDGPGNTVLARFLEARKAARP